MKLKIDSFIEHRSRSVQPALAPLGIGTADGVGVLAPGGCTCTFGCSCSCSCGVVSTTGVSNELAEFREFVRA